MKESNTWKQNIQEFTEKLRGLCVCLQDIIFFSVFLPEFLYFTSDFFFLWDVHSIVFERTLGKYALKDVTATIDLITLNIHHRPTCSFSGRDWESTGQQNNITQI